ncbi:hypothetical protein [Confluentibacter flavum]|uniref:Uncharacterized protein n=1 Tax=Confluentibacter flavum TaxID=1909700 RepID=A0A2N3HG55_9FLAO|nr:hypothetical protein [Confluentibacter flavum]PKQ43768.1 hypothetical protein CSW08_17405 [Confluentibacter flavum]
MPFGESFQSTIRSNKSIMLDKTKRFVKTPGSFDWTKSQQFNFPKSTPRQLKLIKEKIQLDKRRNGTKQIGFYAITIFLLIALIVFLI